MSTESCGRPSGEQRRDRIAVADDHPIDVADLTGLGADAESSGRPDQRTPPRGSGARHLQGHRTPRLGQRAVREERAAPGGLAVTQAAADDLRRQTPGRTTTTVDQTGLSGQRRTVLDHRTT